MSSSWHLLGAWFTLFDWRESVVSLNGDGGPGLWSHFVFLQGMKASQPGFAALTSNNVWCCNCRGSSHFLLFSPAFLLLVGLPSGPPSLESFLCPSNNHSGGLMEHTTLHKLKGNVWWGSEDVCASPIRSEKHFSPFSTHWAIASLPLPLKSSVVASQLLDYFGCLFLPCSPGVVMGHLPSSFKQRAALIDWVTTYTEIGVIGSRVGRQETPPLLCPLGAPPGNLLINEPFN